MGSVKSFRQHTQKVLINMFRPSKNIHLVTHFLWRIVVFTILTTEGKGRGGSCLPVVSALSAGEYITTFPMMVNLGTATGGLNVTITSQVGVYALAERIEKLLFFASTLRENIICVQCDINEKSTILDFRVSIPACVYLRLLIWICFNFAYHHAAFLNPAQICSKSRMYTI